MKKSNPLNALKQRLPDARFLSMAPGRVNLLGEHVDYNGGAVLPAAIDRTVEIAARERNDELITLLAMDLDAAVELRIPDLEKKIDKTGQPLPQWALYPAGVAWSLQKNGYCIAGIDAVYTSDVPIGSGLSSSAAVEVAFAALWQAIGDWQLDKLSLAKYCLEAENTYVGLNCGLMDQFASAHGVKDHVLYFDTRSLEFRPVPLPQGFTLVIADSGVRRTLATSAYNERQASCKEAMRILKQYLPGIQTLRDVGVEEFEKYKENLPPIPSKRAGYVVHECARVNQALVALEGGEAAVFGKLMFENHIALRDEYEVSCPELDWLVEMAGNLPGCLGARLTGAGFGGCTVNLVEFIKVEDFIQRLKEGYALKSGRNSDVFQCHASNGVEVIRLNK
jgi:galactokinase